MDLQIEGRQIDVRPEWRADIESRLSDLNPSGDVLHIRVTLTKQDHRKDEDSHDVVVVVLIPGHTVTARKQQNSFEEAIREAFEAVETELDNIRDKRASHEVRLTAPPEKGVVTKLFAEEGYGFITMDNGVEVYFHRNAVHDMAFEKLDGMEVRLTVGQGEKGPQATTVNPIEPLEHYVDKQSAA